MGTPGQSNPAAPPTDAEQKLMSFREHLAELRSRLVRIALALLGGFFVAWEFRVELFEFLSQPVADALADNGIYQFQAITLTESIVVYVKTAFMGALVFLSPYVFWELWAFIAPGLYAKEKRFILPLTGFSVAFFLLGSAFAYVVLLPFLADWLVNLSLESGQVDIMVTLQNTYSFAFSFLLMFGLVFELPLVLFFLSLWGVVSGRGLLRFWRYFVVISFIVAGILTPPDPLSQVFMAVPLNILYGFGVVVAFSVSRARASGRSDASRVALRAMALSMLAFLVIGSGAFVYIAGLPQKPLHAFAPPASSFVAGFNPKVLSEEKSILGLVRSDPRAEDFLDTFARSGRPVHEMTDALLIADSEGRRAIVLRDNGLGELASTLPSREGLAVGRLDDDTLALGEPDLISNLAAHAPTLPDLEDEETRLLRRLPKAGPLWVWLPPDSPNRNAILGRDNAADLRSAGAALGLGARRRIVFDLPDRLDADKEGMSGTEAEALRAERADRVEARIEAARVSALSQVGSTRDAVKAALVLIGRELGTLSAPESRQRIEAALAPLEAAVQPIPEVFPALSALAPMLRGVSVRRDTQRLTITAELADEGLTSIFSSLMGRTAAPNAIAPGSRP
jgi:sec-independent protein translocase protein TatC